MPETPWSHDDQMMVTSPRQNFFSRQLSQFSTIEDLSELNPFDAEFKAALSKCSHDTIDSALEPMTPGPLSPIDVLGEFIQQPLMSVVAFGGCELPDRFRKITSLV